MLKTNCIMCPLGCELAIEKSKNEIKITGNGCTRGIDYGKAEMVNPMRNISSLVKLENGSVVAVKTSGAVPKSKINACLKEIGKQCLKTKPKMGSVIIPNILGLGVDVVCIGY